MLKYVTVVHTYKVKHLPNGNDRRHACDVDDGCAQTHTHARTHASTHTHTYTHTHTHTHTHTQRQTDRQTDRQGNNFRISWLHAPITQYIVMYLCRMIRPLAVEHTRSDRCLWVTSAIDNIH